MITYKAKNASGEIINSALTPFAFPAGEAHIKREDRRGLEPIEIAILQSSPDSIHDDLFHLAMWNDYVLRENVDLPSEARSMRVVLIPYFPGARADRGLPFGLGVYADFIRDLGLNQIVIFDPHSGMTGDTLHAAADKLSFVYPHDVLSANTEYAGIIAPDKGAVARAQAVADKMGIPLYTAEKTRNFETGKLSGYELDMPSDRKSKHLTERFLVVDDICDGGGTFVLLSDAFHKIRPEGELDLYVSHGVFSGKAFDNLNAGYTMIATTNSYNPLRSLPLRFHRMDVIRRMLDEVTF